MSGNVIPFKQLMIHEGDVYIEFRLFSSANTLLDTYNALFWSNNVFNHYEIKNPQYGKDWRLWSGEPTKEERAAVPWEE